MRILVTGANGFVGQMLCARMLPLGWQVRGTVRSMKQASNLPAKVECVCIDSITGNTDWSMVVNNIDVIVHLAARVHVMRDSTCDPLTAYRQVNVDGTEYLARMAASLGVRRFVFLSSVKVNGEGKSTPYTEQDEAKPEDPYGISKWEAELVLRKIAAETGLEVVILRSPLIYGPGVKANFCRLLKIVQHGIPLPLLSVDNRRSLLYLGNLVDAIIKCINHPRASKQTYLISDGEDVSTPELLIRIAKALGKSSRLIPFPPLFIRYVGNLTGKSSSVNKLIGSLVVDISKIQHELQWEAPYTMIQGLQETAKWFLKGKL